MYPLSSVLNRNSRLGRRTAADIRLLRRASERIEELSAALDIRVGAETRSAQRLEHLRHTTGQITRIANDGVHAYRRVTTALREERARADVDLNEVSRTSAELTEARRAMLEALEALSHRYPWAEPFSAKEPSGR